MDSVTQANAANAEESASASEELSAQARELGEMVMLLTRTVRGDRAASETSSAAAFAPLAAPRHVASTVHTMTAGVRHHHGTKAGMFPSSRATAPVTPEEVIPLDDEDLADF